MIINHVIVQTLTAGWAVHRTILSRKCQGLPYQWRPCWGEISLLESVSVLCLLHISPSAGCRSMPMGEVANIILNKNLHLFGIKNIFFKSIFSGLWLSEKVGPKSPKVTLVDTIKLQSQLVPPLPSARYHPRTTIRALPSARVQSQSSQLLVPDVSQLRQGLEQNTSHCRCHSVQQGCQQASIMAMGINIDDYFWSLLKEGIIKISILFSGIYMYCFF